MDYFKNANDAYNKQEYKKAIELYSKSLKETDVDYNKCNTLHNIGVCYIKLYKENKDEIHLYDAIKMFKLASDYDGKVKDIKMNDVYYNLAACYKELKMFKESYLYLKMALCKNPEDEATIKFIEKQEKELFNNILKKVN